MIIELPKSFIYSDRNKRSQAYVEGNILYVDGNVDYEDLMYTLTYVIKGYNRCYYCGTTLTHSNRTLDHMFPRAWGGVSIPANLIPSCSVCNGKKSDMTYNQYIRWKKNVSKKKRDAYYREASKKNRKTIEKGLLVLPQSWTVEYDIAEVIERIDFPILSKSKYSKLEEYFEKNHAYPIPIIVSANGWVFKGLHILYHAKTHNIKRVPAIILENVVKI